MSAVGPGMGWKFRLLRSAAALTSLQQSKRSVWRAVSHRVIRLRSLLSRIRCSDPVTTFFRVPLALLVAALLGHASLVSADTQALSLRHVRTITNEFAITTIAWHADGRRLAVGQSLNKRVAIWDMYSGRQVRTLENEPGGVRTLAYSPNGKYLAVGREFSGFTRDRAHVHLYDAESGSLLQRFSAPPPSGKGAADTEGLAFSPNSRLLAASGFGSRVNGVIYDIPTGKVVWPLLDPDGPSKYNIIKAISFSPDGQFVALGRIGGQIEIWSVKSGKLIKRFDAQSAGVQALAFSPDGKYVVSGTNIGERWDRTLKPARQQLGQFPDDIVFWSVPTFEKAAEYPSQRQQTPGQIIVETLQFSPDGKLLLVSARTGSLEIVHAAGGTPAFFKGGYQSTVRAALSPDGKQLALGIGRTIELHELSIR